MKRLFVTIDTEMDADIKWHKKWPPEYSSVLEGIPKFYRPLWDRYDVHPIYFLSPEILYSEECCAVFKEEVSKGAIIGAHLHPEYIEPDRQLESAKQNGPAQFPCYDCSIDIEKAKIENLTELIEDKLGVRPVWYRAARFGADDDTYSILDQLGYQYESSVTPGIDWSDRGGVDYSVYSSEAYHIEGTNLTEYPVTIDNKRWGFIGRLLPNNWLFYKWLRPTHMTYCEMKGLIKKYALVGRELVMMFHSMEIMINKTPYVRNGLMQRYYLWRLDRALKCAHDMGYSL